MRRVLRPVLRFTLAIAALCASGCAEDPPPVERDAGTTAATDSGLARRDADTPDAGAVAGGDGGATDAGVTPPPDIESCLTGATDVETFSGALTSAVRRDESSMPAGGVLDLSEAAISHPPWYPVLVDADRGGQPAEACIHGGFVHHTTSDWSRLNASWSENYTENHASFFNRASGGIVERGAVYNGHDGHRANGGVGPFTVRDVWFNYIRDDCSENDTLRPGAFERVLFDGCYVAFSTRPSAGDSSSSGRGQLATVRDSLVRLEPMPGPFRWSSNPGGFVRLSEYADHDGYFGHGALFKRPDASRQLDWAFLGHNIFFLQDGGRRAADYDFPSAARVTDCEELTLIWLGDGTRYGQARSEDYPGDLGDLPTRCARFELITDEARGRAAWEEAVNRWFDHHPDVGAFRDGLPTEVPTRPAPGAYELPAFPRYAP